MCFCYLLLMTHKHYRIAKNKFHATVKEWFDFGLVFKINSYFKLETY